MSGSTPAPRLHGKVAVITGAASGIGRASALRFAAEGARVVVADIQDELGLETVTEIQQRGGEAAYVSCDVASGEQVRRLFEKVVEQYGRVDVVYANAGIGGFATRLTDISEERWQRIIATDLTGPFLCLKYGIPRLAMAGGGSVIVTASIGGMAAFPGSAAYSAAKGGLIALVRTAAVEYADQGVRVNAISPGYVKTNLATARQAQSALEGFHEKLARDTPLGRMAEADEIASVALFLASDESAFVTGVTIAVDGGVVAGNISPGWPIRSEE